MTNDAAQHRSWTFYEVVNYGVFSIIDHGDNIAFSHAEWLIGKATPGPNKGEMPKTRTSLGKT